MLQDIYLEYSEDIFDYILSKLNNKMNGQQVIEIIVKSILFILGSMEKSFIS